MKPARGYYSVIQYCPDLGRFEAANIGVLLFCPEHSFLKGITSRTNQRIARFFGREGHDIKRIDAMKRGIEDRLQNEAGNIKSVEDLERFIGTRANAIQITRPNPIKVTAPEEQLKSLFQEIVGEVARSREEKSIGRSLSEMLHQANLGTKLATDLKVEVPVLQKQLEIPFGFQNGRFNLIKPVRFASAHAESLIGTACRYAVEGRSLFEHRDPGLGDMQLVVVGDVTSADEKANDDIRRVLQENHVRLYKKQDIPQLIQEIRARGKDLGA